jgi:hypothetical protein
MPVWGWILIGVVAAGLVAAIAAVSSAIWKKIVARYLRTLIGKREEARSVWRAFDELIGGLQQGTDEQRARFADDPEAAERHLLADFAERARAFSEEVNTMPMPRQLVAAAEALADASDILAEEAHRAGEGSFGDESLEALTSADLKRVSGAFAYADAQVAALSAEFGIDEQDVYVRGLYI